MRGCKIIIYLILFNTVKSQNLVPNPSFEIYSTCPSAYSQITYCNLWQGPTNNDADYFNSCSSVMGIPHNDGSYGYQPAKSGNGYAGAWMYNGVNNNYREYLQTTLLNVLIPNKCYYVEFYCNLENNLKYAVNNISLAFSNSAISNTGTGFIINVAPDITKYGNPIIDDTLDWVKISGIYTAIGGENYLTIGNFKNDVNTDTLNTGNGTYNGAYYYFEDVSVIPIDSIIGSMPAYAGIDKNIAIGDSVFIGQEISNLNCNWYIFGGGQIASNSSGIYVTPSSPTTYVVEQNLCGTITYDTVIVTVNPTMLKEYNTFSNGINVFPNPTTNNFTISNLTESSKLKVDITDTHGELYSTELITTANNKATIKTNLPNGVYFVAITDNISGLKAVKKLIVQK